ncbi:MAG TPA: hypothetical protein VFT28_11120 [Gemmatimonadales bacterium]|nr:hypothetical protein [Gemmatimonadales bacterium]
MRSHLTVPTGRTAGLVLLFLLPGAPALVGQVPSKIPSDPEAQIFNLIKRVTALEEQLAALTNGTASLKVRAPFVVTDPAGQPVLQVTNAATPLGKKGIVIVRDAGSDLGAIALFNGAGEDLVKIAQGPSKPGGILLLSDPKGVERAEFTGDGRLALSEGSGEAYLVVAQDVSKEDANIRIGGDDNGYAVEVGAPTSQGAAILGTDDEGVGTVTLSDEQGKERAVLDGAGRLEISDDAGRDILSVSEDVLDKDAGVAITLTDGAGQVRVTDKTGKPAAGVLGDSHSMVVIGAGSKVTAEMVGGTAGGGLFQSWGEGKEPLAVLGQGGGKGGAVQISNGQVTVSMLGASDGGAGRLQVNDSNGTPVVEAGVAATTGVGVVRVGPRYRCGAGSGVPAGAALGMAAKALLPDCLIGIP